MRPSTAQNISALIQHINQRPVEFDMHQPSPYPGAPFD